MQIVILTGGGTGGHIYPNLALLPELAREGFSPVYFGGEGGMEESIVKAAGVRYYGFPVVKLARSLSLRALANDFKIPFVLSSSTKQAANVMKELGPVAVFSKGGFASLPAVLAAAKLNIPLFAHESDLTLGLANKIAKAKGATIFKANPLSKFDGLTVGMPIREELRGVDGYLARRRLCVPTDAKVLLVLGGSSGAEYLNRKIREMLCELTKKYFVIHVTGKGNLKGVREKNYLEVEYADPIGDFYAASDLVVSRAGATAVFEICALSKRAIFVPLPKGVSRGDQVDNAALASSFGAYTVWQDERFCDNFLSSLEKASQNPPARAISDDANGKIVRAISSTIRRGVKCKDKKLRQNVWR